MSMQPYVANANERYWRTDMRMGRSIYVLLSNDPNHPSKDDLRIGTMESSVLAEQIVYIHNVMLAKFGKRYQEIAASL